MPRSPRRRTRRRRRRGLPSPAWLALPRGARRALLAVLVIGLLGGSALWLRDSALFSVEKVTVTGVSDADARGRMRAALRGASRGMSTLNVDEARLRTALDSFPQVRALEVSRRGAHGLEVRVIEHVAVAAVSAGGRRVPVSADGTLLTGLAAPRALPAVPLERTPTGDRLEDPAGLRAVRVLAAAPPQLRRRAERVAFTARGLGISLRAGPDLYFGGPERVAAKWAAAAAVLGDDSARGARYLDLRVPERPAAGGLDPALLAPPPPESEATSETGEDGVTDEETAPQSEEAATDGTETNSQVEG